jgi:uncharacterized protein (TIGR03663 family)
MRLTRPGSFGVYSTVVALVGLAALATRFWGLGGRFMHHDEAVHAWFAAELLAGRGYHADPVYHGPLLYHLEALAFSLFGAGDLQARLVSALAGAVLVVALVFLFRRIVGPVPALVAAVLATTSPTLVFYSRFNNHDALVALWSLVLLWVPLALGRFPTSRVLALGTVALSLGIATKLNIWFIVAAAGSWMVFRARHSPVDGRDVWGALRAFRGWPWLGLLAAFVLGALYLTTFRYHGEHAGGFATALTRTASAPLVDPVMHWATMHAEERLGGPFHYYGVLLLVYEPLILLGALGLVVEDAVRRRRLLWLTVAAAAATGLGVLWLDPDQQAALRAIAHLDRLHVPFVVLGAGLVLGAVRELLARGRDTEAYLVCVASTVTALYSYAGEKVPWLAVHVVVPWLLVVAIRLTRWWGATTGQWRGMLATGVVVCSAIATWSTVALLTFNRHNVGEPMLQVEFAGDVRLVVDAIVQRSATAAPGEPVAEIERPYQWPFHWYLRDVRVNYVEEVEGLPRAPFVLAGRASPADLPGYTSQQGLYHTGSWWLGQASALDARGLVRFWWRRDRWGPRWTSRFYVWRLDEPRDHHPPP